jgi:hypothetical protein
MAGPVSASQLGRGPWAREGVRPITPFAAGPFATVRVGEQIASPHGRAAPGRLANAITGGSNGALPAGPSASAGSAGTAGGTVLGLVCAFLVIASGRYLGLLLVPEIWRSTFLFALPERPG